MVKHTTNLLQFRTDLVLRTKYPPSGVKTKIATFTTKGTTQLHTMLDVYCPFWG